MCPIHGEKDQTHITIQPGHALVMTYKRKDHRISSCSFRVRNYNAVRHGVAARRNAPRGGRSYNGTLSMSGLRSTVRLRKV